MPFTVIYWVLGIVAGLALLTGILYLCCLYPGKRRDTTVFRRTKYAHRGLHDAAAGIPENSLAAFRRAREAGLGVEFDIQFTADRQIVVFHDATLLRMCGVDKQVDELTYAQLDTYTLLNTDQHIPLLIEVLEVLQDTPVVCEIKSYGRVTDTSLCEAAWPLLAGYQGPLCIESFNPFMVRWFYKNQPRVVRGILSMLYTKNNKEVTKLQGFALTSLLLNFYMRPDFIAYQFSDSDQLSFRLCRRLFGIFTVAWTIRSRQEEAQATADFDTIIFEGYIPDAGQN